MRRIVRATLLLAAASTLAAAQEVEVFTDARHPPTGIEAARTAGARVTVYELDAPTALEAELGADLPADPGEAAAEARGRLERLGTVRLRAAVEAAFAAQRRALDYGLARYPAIVINGEALLYGLTDLPEALARYRRWREGRPRRPGRVNAANPEGRAAMNRGSWRCGLRRRRKKERQDTDMSRAVRCGARTRNRLLSRAMAVVLLALAPTAGVLGGSITTPSIVSQTLQALGNCLKWTLIGLCVWLDCDITGCRIRISVLWGNYNPDLVISGYHRVGDNPWREMAALYGPMQKAAGQGFVALLIDDVDIGEGNRPDDKYHRAHKDLRFKESDAIGHPASLAELLDYAILLGLLPDTTIVADRAPSGALDATPLLCPRETRPFVPYLLSTLDFIAWRLSLPEMLFPQALIPGVREIGHWPANTWQAVYPRSGWTMQMEDPKSGAVVSQRAGDVVTRTFQPHVYIPTSATRSATPGVRVWYPGPLYETDRRTGMFQMLVPLDSQVCEVFGQTDLVQSWANGKSDLPVPHQANRDRAMDYAFNLWRPYECCLIKGDTLLTTIRWTDFPP